MTKKQPLEIEGLIDHPRWYNIPCKCDHSNVEKEYPIANCLHCKFDECEKSMPRECFDVIISKKTDGEPNGEMETVTINKITIVRGKKYDDIIGWVF